MADLGSEDVLKTQKQIANAWKELNPTFPETNIHTVPSIEDAVHIVDQLRETHGKPVDTLVTGSLLLVGGLIEVAGLTKVALGI